MCPGPALVSGTLLNSFSCPSSASPMLATGHTGSWGMSVCLIPCKFHRNRKDNSILSCKDDTQLGHARSPLQERCTVSDLDCSSSSAADQPAAQTRHSVLLTPGCPHRDRGALWSFGIYEVFSISAVSYMRVLERNRLLTIS